MLTLLAMIAFAGNSLLCRVALKQTGIDAASFTFIRLLSGAIALWLVMHFRKTAWTNAGNWPSALALFAYAAAFSFAYLRLSAGTGALLLFGAVQATMIFWGLRKGERLRVRQLVGLALAMIGLVVLVFPGIVGAAADKFDPDAAGRCGVGHLFAAGKRHARSRKRHGGKFLARRSTGSRPQPLALPDGRT